MWRAVVKDIKSKRGVALHLWVTNINETSVSRRVPQGCVEDINFEQEHKFKSKVLKRVGLLPIRCMGQCRVHLWCGSERCLHVCWMIQWFVICSQLCLNTFLNRKLIVFICFWEVCFLIVRILLNSGNLIWFWSLKLLILYLFLLKTCPKLFVRMKN